MEDLDLIGGVEKEERNLSMELQVVKSVLGIFRDGSDDTFEFDGHMLRRAFDEGNVLGAFVIKNNHRYQIAD